MEAILEKLKKYCAYQERSHKEVRSKLLFYEVYGDTLEEIMMQLVQENFLNEERYARAIARGKFRMKGWGKNKILQHLKFHQVSAYCIKKAMTEIDETEYRTTLKSILEKYAARKKFVNQYDKKNKLYKHGISKGYESYLIQEIIKEIG